MFYPREAEKDHLYNRIVLLTVACCVLLFLASLAKHSGSIYGAIRWSAVEVNGTVTQLESIPMNENGIIIRYRYTDGDQQVHEDEYVDQRYNEHDQYEVGGDVPLLYSRWFPQISSIATELHTYRASFFVMAGGVLLTLVFFGISFMTFGRIYRMKEEDRFY
ncbi:MULTISPECIES: DUF3592 domain-containing protein [unclassified Pseudomonas]|uniref:DUF3592 domain-containing protein n=1 Tax=unclassified Pseudomonas TaxID=196821 RepID=UPI0005BB814D|nr:MULTISPECIES: DUF3592 domain-containing protein [unclassified Pseudomonas]KIR13152.1 hypothetical protein PFLU4_57540 [Pseudomonas fluorescens]